MSRWIPDNPAITRAERNGYEPWLAWGYETESAWIADQEEDEEDFDYEEDFYGNETSGF